MRQPAVIGIAGLALVILLCLFAVLVAMTSSVHHWSGARVVDLRVIVMDKADYRPIPGARVRLIYPGHPNDPLTGATTADEGVVRLVNEFRASGGGSGWREWEVVSYGGWFLSVEADGYRPFFAPLGREAGKPSAAKQSGAPVGLRQPVHGRVECIIPLTVDDGLRRLDHSTGS